PSAPTNLVWTASTNGIVCLNYGHATNALNKTVTNALSGVNAATLGLTNAANYWRVDNVVTGDFGTAARVMGPVWSFSIMQDKALSETVLSPVSAKASPNVLLYQYVPASVSVAARLDSVRAVRRYTAKGLPYGLKINAASGVISGIPKRAGVSYVTVKAAGAGTASVIELEIEVLACPAFALGEFQGMVLDDAGRVRGALALKVSKTGALSGKIESGGRSRSLRGAWLDGGAQARAIRLAAGRAEAMELSLTPEGVEGVTAEGWRVLARQLLSPQAAGQIAGSYTAVLRAEAVDTPGAPAGYGYVTYTVAPRTRSVKYGGLLADGTRVSGSAKVVAGDDEGAALFPLYKGLYARRGEVSGVAVSMPDGGVVFGQGGWVNPGGGTARQGARMPFDTALDGEGARFAQPADWRMLDGAWLTADGQPFAALSAAGGKPVAQTAGVAFALTKRSGLFTGRFTDDDNMARAFKGVYMPALLYGAGFYLCPDDGGGTAPCSLPVELE
ncbi:MAG: putative Ig domain-containing protein, partial [Kiritimatiellae bacterium]|nr:putative Ig domain-containing protein [Kiritimatiellia bacterium]